MRLRRETVALAGKFDASDWSHERPPSADDDAKTAVEDAVKSELAARLPGLTAQLERRITEVQAQDERLTTWLTKVDELAAALRAIAAEPPSVSEGADHAPRLSLVRAKPAPASAPAEAAGGSA